MEVSEGSQTESVSQKGPLPSSMMWVKQLRNYVGSGEGLGSEQLTGLSFDQCHFFPLSSKEFPLHGEYETRNSCEMISKSKLCLSLFPQNFQSSYEYLIHHLSEISRSHSMIIQVFPIIMLTMEPRMVNTFGACRPISLKHMMHFWCPFLDPHLTTYHSSIGVQVTAILDKNLSTLLSILLSGVSDLQQLYCGHVFLPSI